MFACEEGGSFRFVEHSERSGAVPITSNRGTQPRRLHGCLYLSVCVYWFHIEQVAMYACPGVSGRNTRLVVTYPGLDIVMSDTRHDGTFSSPRQIVVLVEYKNVVYSVVTCVAVTVVVTNTNGY